MAFMLVIGAIVAAVCGQGWLACGLVFVAAMNK